MIVSDRHEFVFVHIPKCAGTSVRRHLQDFDDRDGLYTGRVAHHPKIGLIDFVHLPLFVLSDHFPAEFANVRKYWAFAILRNPFERFASSLTQRVRMYGYRPLQKLSDREIEHEIRRAIEHLGSLPKGNHLLAPEFIHFQRQSDYIFLNGERIVQSVYRVDEVGRLLAELGQRIGVDLRTALPAGPPRENRSVAHRSDLVRRIVETLRPATGVMTRALPEAVRERMRALVYVARDDRLGELFRASQVHNFVQDYYQEDIALWESVQRRAA